MIPYIFFVILILWFRHNRSPILIYMTLVMFNVLRYNTGWDYMSYIDEVEYWGSIGSNMMRYSILWQWLFECVQEINMPHIAIAVPGFLTITIVYFVVNALQKNKGLICDILSIYAFWPYFFLGSFSTIRQSLGIAIGLLILFCAIKKKLVWFIIFLIVNYLIHPSSVVCVCYAAFFIPKFRLRIWHMAVILTISVVALFSINIIIQHSPFAIYESYLSAHDSYGSKLSILLFIILMPTLLLRTLLSRKSG